MMNRFPLPTIPYLSWTKGGGRRWFGANRDSDENGPRTHAGCDLFRKQGTAILSVGLGTYVKRRPFYKGTDFVVVRYGEYLVRYGEVDRDNIVKGLRSGKTVQPGETIAFVGKLRQLHLEMYKGAYQGNLTQYSNTGEKGYYNHLSAADFTEMNFQRHPDLIDPTPFINAWKVGEAYEEWEDWNPDEGKTAWA